jgi:hypothetical protein
MLCGEKNVSALQFKLEMDESAIHRFSILLV